MPFIPLIGSANGVKGPVGLSATATPTLNPRWFSPLGDAGK